MLDVLPRVELALLPGHLPVELLTPVTPGPDHFSLLAEVSASPYKHENADDVVERTIEGMVASELLTPEQAERQDRQQAAAAGPYSYPVPTIGRDRALAVIQPWLMSHDIYSRGRFGAWRYEIGNTDHSVMMGVELADHLVNGHARDHLGAAPR